jgi:hypothetical protein
MRGARLTVGAIGHAIDVAVVVAVVSGTLACSGGNRPTTPEGAVKQLRSEVAKLLRLQGLPVTVGAAPAAGACGSRS